MLHTIELNVGNSNSYTRDKCQNLSNHRNGAIENFGLSICLSPVSVPRQGTDCRTLPENIDLDNTEPDSGLLFQRQITNPVIPLETRCNTRSSSLRETRERTLEIMVKIYAPHATAWLGTLYCLFFLAISPPVEKVQTESFAWKNIIIARDSGLPDCEELVFTLSNRCDTSSHGIGYISCLFFLVVFPSVERAPND